MIAITAALWFFFFFEIHPEPIKIKNFTLANTHKYVILIIFSIFSIVLLTGLFVFVTLGIASSVILFHSIFRNRSIKAKVTNILDPFRGREDLGSIIIDGATKIKDDIQTDVDIYKKREAENHREHYHQVRDAMRQKYDLQPNNTT